MHLRPLTGLAAIVASGLATLGATNTPAVAFSAAPLGYQLMCLRSPALCQPGGASVITVDTSTLNLLRSVNAGVNRSIRPQSDGPVDVWSVNVSAGDCEDYAMTKRQLLIAKGLPPSALRIAYVGTPSGEGHAILVVETPGRTYVLDNLTSSIVDLKDTGYRVISMSGADPLKWS